ncbi:MAG: hypothetical protein EOP45_07500 [Sphingobacteriaceae bacterium]|nr:MAG: hypothetical protein EOP45_07500 [Sphingobacteriaceae bacterium]
MKNFKKAILLVVTGFCLTACKDDLNGNGSVLVKVNHQGLKVGQALVYLNRDSTYHPDSLNDEFDKQGRADVIGEVSFTNLEPGKYFMFAEGKEPGSYATVRGTDSVVVKKRYRQNSYNITIKTALK